MHKGKKPLVVLMAILIMALASCATEKPVPKPEPQPEVTTPTTLPAPVPEVVPATTTTTVAETVTTVPQPSVTEIELRNLFGQANSLRTETIGYEIASVLPDGFGAADAEFSAAKTAYETAMDAVSFDGVKAYPVKGQLEKSIASWEALQAEGLPLRVSAESDLASDMKFKAMGADAPTLAAERYQGAENFLGQADSLAESKDYALAIPAYKQAAAAYDVAAEKATANALREKISANGYAKYADSAFQSAEQKYAAEEDLWATASTEDLKAGAALLRDANSYYAFVVSSGSEYKSFEGKDLALQAQERALSVKADINAPEEFSSAGDILNEAYANQQNGNYESAYLWFGDAAAAFNRAYDATLVVQSDNEAALVAAEAAIQASDEKATKVGYGDNVYLTEAKSFFEKAKGQYVEKRFSDSTVNANEAVNYASLSDNFVDSELQKKADAEAKALLADKAAADPAMADARTRMAWAENNAIKDDYPAEYGDASQAMADAETAYADEVYVPAKNLAERVSDTLSDDFQAKVLADRKAAEAEKARLAEAVAKADAAMTDAQTRMAWANENGISADYPDQYKSASSSMAASFVAYGNKDYETATAKAKQVSSTLSDEFQAKVAVDRKAAEDARIQLAADKAAADPAMADARTRMAWAENNAIKDDYPTEYADASQAMADAETAYAEETYVPAKNLAERVSETLSDEFQAKVAADRKAAEDARIQLAADKAAADPAMADARTRIAWAENNAIKDDYPTEYADASQAMADAETAYAEETYVPAKNLAERVSDTLSDDFQKQVLADRAAKAQAALVKPVEPVQPETPQPVVQQGPTAEELAAAKAAAQAAAQAAAKADIDKAQAKYDWAVSKNAKNNFPTLLDKGAAELDTAKADFAAGYFLTSSIEAKSALATLSGIGEFAPLPAKYVVRLIPERRDCLWRIAEYSFIYNNPLKWPVLYEANKKTFKNPSNPDLIFPGQVLVIPSVKGEARDGTWDSKKTYQPLARK